MDPNYAPAWATLAQVTALYFSRTPDVSALTQRELGVTYAKRALELAPNLAQAHAALGLVLGSQPEAENELRKAVALDPGNSEAWGWLGNYLRFHNKLSEALVAYTRGEELDPFWIFTVGNRILCLADMKDMDSIQAEFERLSAAGEPVLLAKVQGLAAGQLGRPGEKIALNLKLRAAHPEEASWIDTRIANELFTLGYVDEALIAGRIPPERARDYRDDPRPPDALKRDFPRLIDFWTTGDIPERFGRMLPKHGRLDEYVGYYKAAFKSPDAFFDAMGPYPAAAMTPTVVTNLKAAGMQSEADALLQRAEPIVASILANGLPRREDFALQAQYRAVEGRDSDAVSLLSRAVTEGWLPDGNRSATDIAQEPCFAHLVNRPDFQAVRRRIFARIEEERRKVPLDLLAQAYPVPRKLAA
jgi:tetratricopeptide (TPR) repeat protein